LQELPLQQGMLALQVCPVVRHWHCPLMQPRPEQHWLCDEQVFPAGRHAVHCPAAQ
jgi:hypothetical protein